MTYTSEIVTALASGQLVLRDFLVVNGQTLGGYPAQFAYWTGADNVTQNVVLSGSETQTSTNFRGGGCLVSVPDIVDEIGVDARKYSFGLDPIDRSSGSPMDMIFGNNIRAGRVAYYQGVFDPASWRIIGLPVLMFSGRVDGASLDEPEVSPGDASLASLTLTAVQEAVYLTYISHAVESHAQQGLRSGDDLRIYGDTAYQRERWWGMAAGQ